MEKKSNFDIVHEIIHDYKQQIPLKYWHLIEEFLLSYFSIVYKKNLDISFYKNIMNTFFHLVAEQIKKPFVFGIHHHALTTPLDYFQLGQDFFRPLIDLSNSTFMGKKHFEQLQRYIQQGENVVLLANHQIEADPQMIAMMISPLDSYLARSMHFVAGERVTTDPLAVPFSLGCNLFCIFSKKYFDFATPEKRRAMIEHNQKVIREIGKSFDKGGLCLYIASSGGRDRMNERGEVEMALFDPASVALMELLAKKSKKPTHLFGLALSTYKILPPPQSVQKELGEARKTTEAPIHIGFTQEFNFSQIDELPLSKEEKREKKCALAWEAVHQIYQSFHKERL